MKIVSREEFLKLPAGTLFRKQDGGKTYDCGELQIKVDEPENGAVDFITVDFGLVDFEESEKDIDFFAFYDSLLAGNTEKVDWDNTSRDGMFDEEQRFLVYSYIEYLELIKTLIQYLPLPSSH